MTTILDNDSSSRPKSWQSFYRVKMNRLEAQCQRYREWAKIIASGWNWTIASILRYLVQELFTDIFIYCSSWLMMVLLFPVYPLIFHGCQCFRSDSPDMQRFFSWTQARKVLAGSGKRAVFSASGISQQWQFSWKSHLLNGWRFHAIACTKTAHEVWTPLVSLTEPRASPYLAWTHLKTLR